MRELTSLDQKTLLHKVENVFKVVSNFETYKEWFPEDAKVSLIKFYPNGVGSIIQVKVGIIKFNIEMIRIIENKEIIVQYTGAYEGNGIWYFFETVNGTKLMYEIDLKIKNPFVFLIDLFVSVSMLHSNMMAKMFNRLEEYLNKIYNVKSNSINNTGNSQPKIFSLTSD